MTKRRYFCAVKKYFEVVVLIVVVCFVAVAKTKQAKDRPYVIMVSFDGFRHDYADLYDAQNFKDFAKNGVAAEAMIPSYPSKTFPNHYSLVTGLYPDHHGLVDNTFYDAELDLTYSIRNRERVENPEFYGGLPLWQLVQKHGMKSASYFWVGSEAPVAGSFPDYYTIYDGSVSNEARIDQTIDWLKLPKSERPNFITLYFSLVDSQGHATGPDHSKTKESVLEADQLLGLLKEKADALDLPVNIIVVSDHGMEPIYPDQDNYLSTYELEQMIDDESVKMVNNGAHAHLYLDAQTDENKIVEKLKGKSDLLEVYRKSEIPEHLHYGSHDRIGDLLIIMKPGKYISSHQRIRNNLTENITRGEHGFDPYATEHMGAVFYANGPQFKKGLKIGKFENIHVYPLVAEILGINELPEIDGQLSVLQNILK